MTVSRNKSPRVPVHGTASLLPAIMVTLGILAVVSPAHAQQAVIKAPDPQTQMPPAVSEPVNILPSKPRMLSAPSARREKKDAPRPIPQSMSGGSVQIDSLSAVNINEAGVLVPRTGALGLNMWEGTSAELVGRLLPALPINAPSAAMRDLLRRLLLSPARSPEGEYDGGNLIAERISLLISMGDLKGAHDLLRSLPDVSREPELVRLDMELRLLTYDMKGACALAAREMPLNLTSFWKKSFNFCQIINGQAEKAELGISLMREMGEPDEIFLLLAEALVTRETLELTNLPNPSALHFAMVRAANIPFPIDVLESKIPNVARAVATSSLASQGLRLEAAERADAAGALPKASLRQLYASVEFSEADRANPLSRAEVEFGPMVRALLYHTALTQTVPTAKAEAASRAFSLARDEGRYTSTVQVFEPVLDRIPPSVDLKWFAPEAVRAFLVIGDIESARNWYQVLKSRAGFDPEVEKALALFRPIAWLFQFEGTGAQDAGTISDWWQAVKTAPDARDKAALLYSVMEALGLEVAPEAWDPIINVDVRKGVTLPSAGILRRLQALAHGNTGAEKKPISPRTWSASTDFALAGKAGEIIKTELLPSAPAKTITPDASNQILAAPLDNPGEIGVRVGETVLLSLLAIGKAGPAKTDPFVLGNVLRALKVAGLKKEARALALDAVLARGL